MKSPLLAAIAYLMWVFPGVLVGLGIVFGVVCTAMSYIKCESRWRGRKRQNP